ncbi:MAG: YraN family protein [Clostridia bacterium]|nr:YraN family protein [Clostridia bacterium]
MFSVNTRETGRAGERLAERYLVEQKHARILARNYTVRGGEIDLVAEIDGVIAFVEVKLRNRGSAHEAIGYTKQKRLSHAALIYLQKNGLLDCTSRFDAVLIQPDGVEYIERAFDFTP